MRRPLLSISGLRWAALVAATVVGVLGRAAAAGPAPIVALKYDVYPGFPGCPSEAEFRSKVATQLGYDPFLPEAPLLLTARVWQGDEGFEGALDWGGRGQTRLGERRFLSKQTSCQALISAMVFAVSVQIQMMAVAADADASPQATSTSDGDGVVGPPAAVERPAATSRPSAVPDATQVASGMGREDAGNRPPWKGYGGFGGTVAAGVAPSLAALGRLLFAVHNGRWLFEVGAEGSFPATGGLDTGERFSQRLLLGTAAACAEHGVLAACAVAKLGAITVRGIDLDSANSPTGFVAQLGPRVGASYWMGNHLGLHARVDALFLVTPWTVELNGVTAWTMPRLGVSAGIDISVRLE